MRTFLSNIYQYQSSIYKVFLFVISTLFIVYLFPKGSSFKYDFSKGKVWQNETYYAPFDFAVQKSEAQLSSEKKALKESIPYYFILDTLVAHESSKKLITTFNKSFPDSLNKISSAITGKKLQLLISEIYQKGVLNEDLILNKDKAVVLKIKNSEAAYNRVFSDFLATNQIQETIDLSFKDSVYNKHRNYLTTLIYNNLRPNVTIDNTLNSTAYAIEEQKISPTIGLVKTDAIIIAKGEVIEGVKYQKLISLKTIYTSQAWGKSNYYWVVIGYILLVVLALLMLILFLKRFRESIYNNNKKLTFIFFNIMVMIIITTIILKHQPAYLYIAPLCILPLILKSFFDARLGLFTHVITVLLLGFIVPNSYEYMFLQIIAGIITILSASELYKRAHLFTSVTQITIVYIVSYFSFYIIHEGNIATIEWSVFAMFLLCGLAMLFVQPLIYIYEKVFGLVSDVSLLELSDTNSALLKLLANKAPGTFHHSLSVANLAEAAANEIGANAMLVRVGALYHDIGKMSNPTFFIENQSNNINPHNELSPKESATIIIDHVLSGIEIAKQHNLPDRVIDFIRTHHGTSAVHYFYSNALKNSIEEEVKKTDYQYRGPKPFSKETAILMMCDSVEAASKSIKEPDYSKINTFVENVIEKQKNEGQFLNANITFKEIEIIKKVLKQKLINIYHIRITYPD